jgi:predicted permease
MLQRIQTIYLLLASVALFALFFFPIAHDVYTATGPKTIKIDGVYEQVNGQLVRSTSFLVLTIVCIIVALLPLFIISRYKNLRQQYAFCMSLIMVLFGFSYWMANTVTDTIGKTEFGTSNMGIGMFLSSLSIIFLIMAIKAIRQDEKLLKSVDRLR